MDLLSNPALLLSGLFISLVGMALFMYGKKQGSLKCLVAGVALCGFPYFVTSLAVLWLVAGGCIGGLYLWARVSPT